MNNHLHQCPKVEVACECGFDCTRDAMDQHRAKDCPMVEVVCDVIGCNVRVMRKDYEKHRDEAAKDHVCLLSSEVGSMKKENVRQSADVVNLKQENRQDIARLAQDNARLTQDNARLIQDNVRLAAQEHV